MDETTENRGTTDLVRCSFCKRSSDEVTSIIAGPEVFICDICVQNSVELRRQNSTMFMPEITSPTTVYLVELPLSAATRSACCTRTVTVALARSWDIVDTAVTVRV